MNYWNKNLKAINSKNVKLITWLLTGYKRLKEETPIHLIEAKEGYTATYNGIYLYSKYRPTNMNTKIKLHKIDEKSNSIIWLGLGLGYEFIKWYKENEVLGKVYIVESEPAMIAAFLILHDVTSLLEANKIEFITETSELDSIRGNVFENRSITKHWYYFYGKVLLGLFKESKNNKAIIMNHITFSNDLAKAAKELDWEILELDWQDENSLAMIIAEYNPAFVVTINISERIQKICRNLNIPYKSWTVDIPAYNFFLPENQNLNSWHFTADVHEKQRAIEMGITNISYLGPASVNRKINQTEMQLWDKLKDYIVFVGNTAINSEFKQLSNHISDKTMKKINEILLIQLNSDIWLTPNLLEEFIKENPDSYNEIQIKMGLKDNIGFTVKDKISYIIGKEITGMIRKEIIKKIAKRNKVAVFGDEGWHELKGERNFYYGGSVNHYKDLPSIFNNAGVNINLTRLYAIGKIIPVRVFDVLGSGGFLLSNNDKSLERYFIDGKHLIIANASDIADKASEWLNKPLVLRKEIANNGQKRVLEKHTMEHRWWKIIDSGGKYEYKW